MWPVTFEMILFLVAFLASLIALSYLFNRTLGIVARAVAATLTLLLVVAWVTNTVLWMQDGMPGSMFGRMWNFDGLPFIAVALYSLGTSAVLGHGPITVGMKWLRKIPLKKE